MASLTSFKDRCATHYQCKNTHISLPNQSYEIKTFVHGVKRKQFTNPNSFVFLKKIENFLHSVSQFVQANEDLDEDTLLNGRTRRTEADNQNRLRNEPDDGRSSVATGVSSLAEKFETTDDLKIALNKKKAAAKQERQ